MNRPSKWIAGAALLLTVLGCQNSAAPDQRDIFGSWVTRSLPAGTFRMTLAETARAVEGAGSYITPAGAFAFGVTGAFADDELSLLFQSDALDDINFQGYFADDDMLQGVLSGGGFNQTPVIFDREDLIE